jgi:hypothetical protein
MKIYNFSSSDNMNGNEPPKKKSKMSLTLAQHSKAIAELQQLPSAIQEIKDLLTNGNMNQSSVDVIGDTMSNLLNNEETSGRYCF